MQGYITVRAKVSIISFFIFVCYPFSFVFGLATIRWIGSLGNIFQ